MTVRPLCSTCGDQLVYADGVRCPSCGPKELRITSFAPTIVIAGPDATSGDDVIKVSAPGATSETRMNAERISVAVTGAGEVGRPGEPRALKTLRQRLHADGRAVRGDETAVDADGEDAILHVDGARYVLQMVTAPGNPRFWQEARNGTARREGNVSDAVTWIRDVLAKKAFGTRREQWKETILAIDARHSGVLATAVVLASYLDRFSSPADEFGFASVWVIGPTVAQCARVGAGRP